MKRIFTIMILGLFAASSLVSQDRYLDEVFAEVSVTADVTYGVNATVLAVPVVGEAIPQALRMDVYQPVGDTETDRPVMLVFHTGNFLPNVTNGQISGTRKDNGVVEICTRLAKRGYVAAAVSYRLGWNPLADNQPTRALGLIQAAYRGIQDGRTAVRYFRRDAEEGGNQFGIDPEKIAAFGTGTGGYLTLGLASLDEYSEIITTTNGAGKFLLDINQDGVPETPMVVPQYHGDIEGKVLTISPDNAFGLPQGDTTNYPNHVDYSSELSLVVNVGGALGDVSWLDENTTPIITVQSAFDLFAPYEDAVLIVPTTGDDIVRVQGGAVIQPRQIELGNHDVFLDAANLLDNEATDLAKANSVTAGHPYYEALYPITNAPNSSGLDEGVVIEWWDPNALSPPILPDFPNGLPWNMLPHPAGGTFHTQGLLLNEGMSEEKSVGNIIRILDYVSPRACLALNLGCVDTKTTEVLDASVMTLTPNPAGESVKVSAQGRIIESIAIFGMDGKLYGQKTAVNSEEATIQRNNLPTGIYLVKAFFQEGVATQKVVFE